MVFHIRRLFSSFYPDEYTRITIEEDSTRRFHRYACEFRNGGLDGVLNIGVADDGEVTGIPDPEGVITQAWVEELVRRAMSEKVVVGRQQFSRASPSRHGSSAPGEHQPTRLQQTTSATAPVRRSVAASSEEPRREDPCSGPPPRETKNLHEPLLRCSLYYWKNSLLPNIEKNSVGEQSCPHGRGSTVDKAEQEVPRRAEAVVPRRPAIVLPEESFPPPALACEESSSLPRPPLAPEWSPAEEVDLERPLLIEQEILPHVHVEVLPVAADGSKLRRTKFTSLLKRLNGEVDQDKREVVSSTKDQQDTLLDSWEDVRSLVRAAEKLLDADVPAEATKESLRALVKAAAEGGAASSDHAEGTGAAWSEEAVVEAGADDRSPSSSGVSVEEVLDPKGGATDPYLALVIASYVDSLLWYKRDVGRYEEAKRRRRVGKNLYFTKRRLKDFIEQRTGLTAGRQVLSPPREEGNPHPKMVASTVDFLRHCADQSDSSAQQRRRQSVIEILTATPIKKENTPSRASAFDPATAFAASDERRSLPPPASHDRRDLQEAEEDAVDFLSLLEVAIARGLNLDEIAFLMSML